MSVPRLELFLHGSSRAGREARAQVESLRSQLAGAPLELTITDLERQPEAGKALGAEAAVDADAQARRRQVAVRPQAGLQRHGGSRSALGRRLGKP